MKIVNSVLFIISILVSTTLGAQDYDFTAELSVSIDGKEQHDTLLNSSLNHDISDTYLRNDTIGFTQEFVLNNFRSSDDTTAYAVTIYIDERTIDTQYESIELINLTPIFTGDDLAGFLVFMVCDEANYASIKVSGQRIEYIDMTRLTQPIDPQVSYGERLDRYSEYYLNYTGIILNRYHYSQNFMPKEFEPYSIVHECEVGNASSGTTSNQQLVLDSDKVMVYPNPVQAKSEITIESDLFEIFEYQISSMSGQVVATGSGRRNILLPQLANGMYILSLTNDGLSYSMRLVIH